MKLSILLAAVLATGIPTTVVGRAIPADAESSVIPRGTSGKGNYHSIISYDDGSEIQRRSPIAMPMPMPPPKVVPKPGKPTRGGNNGGNDGNGSPNTPERPGGPVRGVTPENPGGTTNINPGNAGAGLTRAIEAGKKEKSAWTPDDKKVLEEELTRIQLKEPSQRTADEKALFDKQLADAKKLDSTAREPFQNVMVAEDSGKSAISRLDNVIKNDTPDQHQSVTWEEVVQKYTLDGTPKTKTGKLDSIVDDMPGSDLNKVAKDSGLISGDKKLGDMEFTSYKWENKPGAEQTLQEGLYSTEANAQLGLVAFKSQDALTPATGQLPFSELRWQSWKHVAETNNKSPADLRGFLLHNIAGRNGAHVTEKILGIGYGKKTLEIKPGDTHWNKIIGTDNVKGLIHMMADHSRALGKKKPTSVWLYREFDGTTHMVVRIE